MSQLPPEPNMPEPGAPEPAPARPDRRILYTTIGVIIVAAAAIAAVFIFVPTNHNKLATGLDSPSTAPTATTPAAPSPSVTSSVPAGTFAPAAPAPSPSAPASLTPSASGAPTTSQPTHNVPSPTLDPAIPASFDPVQRVVAEAYIKYHHVTDEVWDDNNSDMELLTQVAEGDELKNDVDLTIQGRHADYESRGFSRVLEVDTVALNADQTMATVTACYDSSMTSTVDLKSGEVVGHGDPPTVEVVYFHRGADGIWRTPGYAANEPNGSC